MSGRPQVATRAESVSCIKNPLSPGATTELYT